MDKERLLSTFAAQELCRQLSAEITAGHGRVTLIRELCGSAKSLAIASAATVSPLNLVLMPTRDEATYCYSDLSSLLLPEQVFFYPSCYKRGIKDGQLDASNIVQRTASLNAVIDKQQPLFIVTYPEALAEKVASRYQVEKSTIRLQKGEKINMLFLRETLLEYGFERADFVAEPGQFALRGSLVDVFSFSDHRPVRVDFFGDEVESIRTFNIDTQLSEKIIEQFDIIANLQKTTSAAQGASLFDFLNTSYTLWLDDPQFTFDSLSTLQNLATDKEQLIDPEELLNAMQNQPCISFRPLPEGVKKGSTLHFNTHSQPTFNKNFDLLSANISEHSDLGYTTYILTDNPAQVERLKSIFSSIGKTNIKFDFLPITLHEGFIDHNLKICCYTDHQIFERYHRVMLKRAVEKSDRLTIQELSNMQQGDYIVHIDHGIGVFGGLVKANINGKVQEMIKLVYRDNDVLFVNIHGLHRISKYKGKEGEPPKVYKLGTGAWQKLKQATKSKVKDIARELTALYAKRKAAEGFAFSPDSYLQNELEASFIYEDTPDQNKTTQDVKADMERSHPMDRLICGDVGFGKTEVAIRAALKAATDGKQVAVLVPTTILALQHYKTFSDRLAAFPVRVEYVSRLKTSKQIKEIIADLTLGKVNIIIGTHRLLNKDILFKDLGLLIVDEEQKFGVSAKEKLKTLKLNVDTLTMTATPIPRTLQFSLMGARDLSIINTPPPNRHPIVTEVYNFQEDIIQNAINYEVERGGQVFFLHNRVQDIKSVEDIIRRLCPDVKTCIGHGQMEGEALEKVVLDFMSGDYDVLICTTIIENGIDIPNANTIIINQAQNFGLSDLHQLRGRVGRSNRKAFCYLLAPPFISMTDDARRRLKAIETFSDLGSGFNIAMQDLDIRGAGNILGGEQSGFIADIGFETYQRILNEALQELRDESFYATTVEAQEQGKILPNNQPFLMDCTIDTDMKILLPDDYISNTAEKIRLYKELNNITEEDILQRFVRDITDRFGTPPKQVEDLIDIVRLRKLAVFLGFEKIVLKNKLMIAYFISNHLSPYFRTPIFSHVLNHIQQHPRTFKLKEQSDKLILTAVNVNTVQEAMAIFEKIQAAK
ncbi:MAG: transcription-repair coupling factor [Prevotellaceae bacterium]|jgi:transcription-repair coupling factor (superfamily II helicase)|nr:transcription-repair coupling factor [Prevotellaceae bacterium]